MGFVREDSMEKERQENPAGCMASTGQAHAIHQSRAPLGRDFSVCPHNGHCEVAHCFIYLLMKKWRLREAK